MTSMPVTAVGTPTPTPHTPSATAIPQAQPRVTPTGRLGQGELRRQVAAHLSANPGSHTPSQVARALNRSAGAVGNALAKLTADGHATRCHGTPVRYQANDATGPAANGMSPDPVTTAAHANAPRSDPARRTAPKPATPVGVPATTGTVTRPNGHPYRPRILADMPDVDALRKLRTAGVPVLLYGPPGTGKTSLVEAAFGEDTITVAGDGDTQVADFIGEYTQNPDGTFTFTYGPLVTAMTDGKVLFIDDATLISPAVLAVVYPAMDGRHQVIVKAHKGETITAADGFYIAAGHNPGVHGAVLTEALSSRFAVQVEVSTDYDLARSLDIDPRAVRVAQHLAMRRDKGEIGWAPQLRELLAFRRVTAVLGVNAAMANLAGVAPGEDRDVVTDVITRVFGTPVIPLALGRQI